MKKKTKPKIKKPKTNTKKKWAPINITLDDVYRRKEIPWDADYGL